MLVSLYQLNDVPRDNTQSVPFVGGGVRRREIIGPNFKVVIDHRAHQPIRLLPLEPSHAARLRGLSSDRQDADDRIFPSPAAPAFTLTEAPMTMVAGAAEGVMTVPRSYGVAWFLAGFGAGACAAMLLSSRYPLPSMPSPSRGRR